MRLPLKTGVLSLVENIDMELRDDSKAGACAIHAGIQDGGGAPGASWPSRSRGGQGLGHTQGQPGQLGPKHFSPCALTEMRGDLGSVASQSGATARRACWPPPQDGCAHNLLWPGAHWAQACPGQKVRRKRFLALDLIAARACPARARGRFGLKTWRQPLQSPPAPKNRPQATAGKHGKKDIFCESKKVHNPLCKCLSANGFLGSGVPGQP